VSEPHLWMQFLIHDSVQEASYVCIMFASSISPSGCQTHRAESAAAEDDTMTVGGDAHVNTSSSFQETKYSSHASNLLTGNAPC